MVLRLANNAKEPLAVTPNNNAAIIQIQPGINIGKLYIVNDK